MNRTARRLATMRHNSKAVRLSPASEAAFTAAVRHHQAGQLQEADGLYRQVLAADPHHADSLHLLGVLALQVGRPDAAADLIERAIAIDATTALYHTNLGNALQALGRLEQSIACYRRAIVLQPRYPEAYNNLGAVLQAQQRNDEAVTCLRRAIALKPDFPEACNNLGNLLCGAGRPDEAIECYRRAVALRPDYAEAHNNLGAALKDAGHLDEAVLSYRKAVALEPESAVANNNLGIALKRLGRLDEAVASCRDAIALQPGLLEAHDALGMALADQGKLDEAVACYQRALALRPDDARAHGNLGTVLKEQGLLDDAIARFRTSIELQPDCPATHHNLAMALLARGDMEEGWREYEWRWQTAHMAAARRGFTQKQWRGEAAAGQTLLIHAEQGLGDTLQFCRYAGLAAASGLRVIMEVQPPLARLLHGLAGANRVVPRGAELGAFDLHCPMQSLPMALETTLATIPSTPSYLRADPAQVSVWAARLKAMDRRGPRVGLAWAGDPAMVLDRQRSLALHRLAPLLAVSGLQFFSLQKGGSAADDRLTDFMAEMDDLADTAALIANLDLVISVDSAVAHLAAGLGTPVWLLDRFDPDWRWLTGRRDSPWYPSLRIYRQPRPGDWESVLTEAARDLRSVAKE